MPARTQQLGEGHRAILDIIARERGLDFSGWRPGCLLRRIDHRIRASGANTVESYRRLLEKNPDEINRLLDSIAINVTEFFRNPEVFEGLARQVIPRIVEEAAAHGYSRIRCWSAGSSNGAEAFTLAILFSEEFRRRGAPYPLSIQATDIDRGALAEAEAGRYPSSAVREVPAALLDRYFVQTKGGYAVADAIRLLVKFRPHDMIHGRPLVANDLILCRNVLIYFSKELQRKVIGKFWKGLRRGGCLVLGLTESLRDEEKHFVSRDPKLRIYTKE